MIKELLLLGLVLFLGLSNCLKDSPPTSPKALNKSSRLNQTVCSDTSYPDWETSEYVLPYPVGESYIINLSHCGGSYHSEGQPDQYAIDFAMNIGTRITAARSGTVIFVEKSGFDGGFPNNLVIVQHSDGTFAHYMHLTHNGTLLNVGQKVNKGATIGISGSTGLAGYPHLHFVTTVSGSWKYPYNSFPTTFNHTSANPSSLEQGKTYTALPY